MRQVSVRKCALIPRRNDAIYHINIITRIHLNATSRRAPNFITYVRREYNTFLSLSRFDKVHLLGLLACTPTDTNDVSSSLSTNKLYLQTFITI